jgi:hypothetical protein
MTTTTPKTLPTLPQSLLNTIGEYGMARTDGVSALEVTHRWQLLISGIKEYTAEVLEAALAAQPPAVAARTFDQWWTEIENFSMRGERLCDLLSKPSLAQVAYDEGVAAALGQQAKSSIHAGSGAFEPDLGSGSQPLVEAPKPIAVVGSKAAGGRRFVGSTLEFRDLPDGTKLYAAPVRGPGELE